MGFRRALAPQPSGSPLTADLIGIGMLFGGAGSETPNIEDTLLAASVEGMERDDLRVLAVLTTWLGVHAKRVNADRLTRLVEGSNSTRVRAYWAAVARWQSKDRRFARIARLHKGPRVDLLPVGQEFQLRRFGEDPRFAGTPLRVDARALRDRASDVLTPSELPARHRGYYWRVVIGPSYRADLWAALEADPGASTSEIARRAYSSIGAAWEARRDFMLVRGPSAAGRAR